MEDVQLCYPEPKPWMERARSIQYIPSGSQGIDETLRIIFRAVQDELSPETVLDIPSSNYNAVLDDVCRRIKPAGLTRKVDGTWRLTDESTEWLENKSNDYLAAILCANVMFMSEMLSHLQRPRTAREILAYANENYGMAWKGTEQVWSRNHWFKALGYVRHYPDSQLYEVTAEGKSFIESVAVMSPEEVNEEKMSQIPQNEGPSDWALEMCDITGSQLKTREIPLRSLPGRLSNPIDTIANVLAFLETPRATGELEKYLKDEQGLTKSLTTHFKTSLNQMGLTEKTARGITMTRRAREWLDGQRAADLACLAHISRRYVFEILRDIEEGANTRQEIKDAAKVKYEITNLTCDNLSARLNLLKYAGLIIEQSGILEITDSGRDLIGMIPLV